MDINGDKSTSLTEKINGSLTAIDGVFRGRGRPRPRFSCFYEPFVIMRRSRPFITVPIMPLYGHLMGINGDKSGPLTEKIND